MHHLRVPEILRKLHHLPLKIRLSAHASSDGSGGFQIRSRSTAKPQVHSARIEGFQGAVLLRHQIGAMIRQHHSSGTDSDFFRIA